MSLRTSASGDATAESSDSGVRADESGQEFEAAWSSMLDMVRRRPFEVATVGLLVLQAVWLWSILSAGWFYQADFDNLAGAARSPLDWSYLTSAQGGHLGLFGRPAMWLLQRAFGLDYWPTIAVRVALQAAATWLLARLLARLLGRSRLVAMLLAAYCFTPLLVPGLAWLTSGIGLAVFQPLYIGAVSAWLTYTRTGRLRSACWTSLFLLVATMAYDGGFAALVALPLLSVAWHPAATIRARSGNLVRRWLGWLLVGIPQAAIAATIVGGGYANAASKPVSLAGYAHLVGTGLFRVVCPSIVGGPWTWSTPNSNYLAFAHPGVPAEVTGLLVWLLLLLIGIRRTGPLAIVAWSVPWLLEAATMILVGAGRFNTFGAITALAYRYAFVLAAPTVLAVGLCLSPVRERAGAPAPHSASASHLIRQRALLAVAGCALLAGSLLSGLTFRQDWSASPAQRWVDALRSDLAASPSANVYDVFAPDWLIPGIETHRRISDILAIDGGSRQLDAFGTGTTVPGADGHLVKSTFLDVASAAAAAKTGSSGGSVCLALVKGAGSWTVPLTPTPAANAWLLRVEFLQARPSVLYLSFLTADGRTMSPTAGSRLDVVTKLDAVWRQLPTAEPTALIVTSRSQETNICITRVEVGYPYPVGSR